MQDPDSIVRLLPIDLQRRIVMIARERRRAWNELKNWYGEQRAWNRTLARQNPVDALFYGPAFEGPKFKSQWTAND